MKDHGHGKCKPIKTKTEKTDEEIEEPEKGEIDQIIERLRRRQIITIQG